MKTLTRPSLQNLINLKYVCWLCLQWNFTSHYLQAACLFRLTFKYRSEETEKAIKNRKAMPILLDILVYIGHGTYLFWLVRVTDFRYWATIAVASITAILFFITSVTLLSMLHI